MYESIQISSSFTNIEIPSTSQPIHFEVPPLQRQPEVPRQQLINAQLAKQLRDELWNSEMQSQEIIKLRNKLETSQKQYICIEEESKKEIQQLVDQIRILSDANSQYKTESERLTLLLQQNKEVSANTARQLQAVQDQLESLNSAKKSEQAQKFVIIDDGKKVDGEVHSRVLDQVQQLASKIKVLENQLSQTKLQNELRVKNLSKQHHDNLSKMAEQLEKTKKTLKETENNINGWQKKATEYENKLNNVEQQRNNLSISMKQLSENNSKLTLERTRLQDSLKEALSLSQTFNFREVVEEKFKELSREADQNISAERMNSVYLKFIDIVTKVYHQYRR